MRRVGLVCQIVQEHYEPGDQSKCYRQVWKLYVNPVYPNTRNSGICLF